MPTIQEIRQRYPQYNDISDEELADSLHKKYYSDIPKDEYYSKISLQKPIQTENQKPDVPDWMMDNPTLAGIYGGAKAIAEPLLEVGGLIGGGIAGAGAGGPMGAVAGAGLGYGAGKGIVKGIETLAGERQLQTIPEGLMGAGKDIVAGAEMEMLGGIGGKVLPAIGKTAKNVYSNVAGLTSTTSKGAVEKALQGGETFKGAMRGKMGQEEILKSAKVHIEQLKNVRRAEYQADLDNLVSKDITIDRKPIMEKLSELMDRFGITKNAKGKLTFTNDSNIDYQARTPLKKLIEQIEKFGTLETKALPPEIMALKNSPSLKNNPEFAKMFGTETNSMTPKQADNLKQLIDDFYTPSKNTRAFTTELRSFVKDKLVEKVPEYSKMTKSYQDTSNTIREIDAALSTGKGKNVDTALRKMQTIYRPINDYRLGQVNRLDKATKGTLSEELAGLALNPAMPRGFFGRVFAGSPFAMGYMAHNPAVLAAAPMFSPRVIGELSYLLGNIGKSAGKYIEPDLLAKLMAMQYQNQQERR